MDGDRGLGEDLIRTVRRRADVVAALADGPLEKRELEDATDLSRSTVNRAVAELTAHDLVRRAEGGYVATAYGCALVRAHRNYLARLDQIFEARPVLAEAHSTVDLPPAVLDGASIHVVDRSAPFRTQRRVAEVLDGATRLRSAVPALRSPRQLSATRDVAESGATVSLLVTPSLLDLVTEEFEDRVRSIAASPDATVAVGDCPWCCVRVVEHGDETTAVVTVRDDDGAATGVLFSDAPAAVEWAEERVESHLDAATDVTDALADPDRSLSADAVGGEAAETAED